MNRFHLVVSNYSRLESFTENFHRIQNFAPSQDAIYIFDCSPERETELSKAGKLTEFGLRWGENLFYIYRRNWGVNHGAQLDYFRCLRDGVIAAPTYVAFLQMHYFDLVNHVKEDTFPEGATYDLNEIKREFEGDPRIGCVFFARYGIRIATSNPIWAAKHEFFGDGEKLIAGAVRRSFLIDGGNFISRPELFLNWFNQHPKFLTRGDGSYGFSIAWEDRLHRILYDQHIIWSDLSRNLRYSTVEEVDRIENQLGCKISKLWYDHRIWYFFYGQDLWKYWPIPFGSFLRHLLTFVRIWFEYPKDTSITFHNPTGTSRNDHRID